MQDGAREEPWSIRSVRRHARSIEQEIQDQTWIQHLLMDDLVLNVALECVVVVVVVVVVHEDIPLVLEAK